MSTYSTETGKKILAILARTGISELLEIDKLNELPGDYINLECTLPNGCTGKILDDKKTYLAAQVEIPGKERCYGVAADEKQIAVYQYGCNGTDAVLYFWTIIP